MDSHSNCSKNHQIFFSKESNIENTEENTLTLINKWLRDFQNTHERAQNQILRCFNQVDAFIHYKEK